MAIIANIAKDTQLAMTLIQLHPSQPAITWEILPTDFILPDDPVENNLQPLLAAALRESLELAGLILLADIIATNFGLCAKVDDKTVVKAPDWLWIRDVPEILEGKIRRSYTPHAEGPVPLIVMEFISETEGQEYSFNPHYPYGKWYFYEQILQVPIYVIFHPYTGDIDVYRLQENRYRKQIANEHGRHWLPEFGLFLGVWQGSRGLMTANWLRWWDSLGNILLWGKESVEQVQQQVEQEHQRAEQERQRAEQEHQRAEQERQRAEQERQRAEQEQQRAEQEQQKSLQMTAELEQERHRRELLAEKLRELGIDPNQLT